MRPLHRLAIVCLPTALAILVAVGCRSSEESENPGRTVTIYVSTDRVFSEPVLREYEQRSGVQVKEMMPIDEAPPGLNAAAA